MSIVIRCTNSACANLLSAEPDMAGKRVQCPLCKEIMEVPKAAAPETAVFALLPQGPSITAAPPEPAEPPVVPRCPHCAAELAPDAVLCVDCGFNLRTGQRLSTERTGPKSSKKNKLKRQQFKKLHLGLGCHYAKILCALVRMLVVIAAIILMSLFGAAVGMVGDVAATCLALVVAGLGIAGSILCCWVPLKSGARALIIASLALDGVSALLTLPGILLEVLSTFGVGGARVAIASVVFGLLMWVCGLAAFVLFMLFLRRLALFIEENLLAEEAMAILVHLAILVGALVGVAIVLGLIAAFLGIGAAFFALALGVGMLVFIIKFLLRILYLVGAVREALERYVAV